ncbi:glycosyltransferase family 2 protein [Aegicerativicinus sediminis]|uniref:glycosyltransferase family 2 protein n=1 Tax=Aegicerativicinus sediminis TaxID=2893202 RepID=UPI001E469B39|nr:glycosyltransferase family 2 protein [Aegicerativicinus sediminis]
MQNPLVSIIIPTYNRAHIIGETLDSVLAQTYTNWECIVVDDGSMDNTESVVQEYVEKDGGFQYHKRPQHYMPGGNGARNYGFDISKGKYVQWFDDDDIMLPEFIQTKMGTINASLDLVICSGYNVDSKLSYPEVIDLSIKEYLFKDYVLWKAQILTPSILFKKEFLLGKDLFSKKIYRGQESEFFSRLFFNLKPNQYVIINKPLFLYRQHNKTKTHLNRQYVAKFKSSQSIVAYENLKRSINLNDRELINYCCQILFIYFFSALDHKDIKTSKFIYKSLYPILKKRHLNIYFEFRVIGFVLLLLKKGSYGLRQRWKAVNL